MTEHIREEYALRKPDGHVFGQGLPEMLNGDAARKHMEWLRDTNQSHNLTVVHRTVTFTDWEEVQ